MQSKCTKTIKKLDVYGIPLNLNINDKDTPVHKTLYGSFASIILFCASVIILVLSFVPSKNNLDPK
jgi:hypothetical protein